MKRKGTNLCKNEKIELNQTKLLNETSNFHLDSVLLFHRNSRQIKHLSNSLILEKVYQQLDNK